MKPLQLLRKLNRGQVQNVDFADFVGLVEAFGFDLKRISGSHHVFVRSDVEETINLQPYHGEAKPYQIRQLMRLVEEYNLKLKE